MKKLHHRDKSIEVRIDRINELMRSTGTDAVALAYHAGISYDYVYKIIRGERPNISAINLGNIARAFGVSSDYLLGIVDTVLTIEDLRGDFERDVEHSEKLIEVSARDLTNTRSSWLSDKCMELAAIARIIDGLDKDDADALTKYFDSQIRQIHVLIERGLVLIDMLRMIEKRE